MGEIPISWYDNGIEITEDSFSRRFQKDVIMENPQIVLEARPMDTLWFEHAACLKKTGGYELLRTEQGMFLMNHWGTCRHAFGIYLDELWKNSALPVYFHERFSSQVPLQMTRFLSSVGLHSKLLQNHAPVIHASYIVHAGRAILFSAPEQTGKSTQARLWAQYRGARTINDDRVLLRANENVWKAYGYPCCGSSNICENETYPVAAIVILEQAPENRVEQMRVPAKIRALVSAMEIYAWDSREVDMAFSMAEEMIRQVPVIKLRCRPDQEAVQVLYQYLEENGYVESD